MTRKFLIPLAGIALLISCTPKKEVKEENKIIDVATFDSSYQPTKDFYEFVNARWIAANPIPATESSWRSFEVVADSVRNKLRKVLESASSDKSAAKGSSTQKVGDFYSTGMDSVAIDKAGIDPVKPWLDSVAAFKSADDIIKFTAKSNLVNSTAILSCFVDQDQKISKNYILYLSQTGLGLP
jgi:putative endopeptidase